MAVVGLLEVEIHSQGVNGMFLIEMLRETRQPTLSVNHCSGARVEPWKTHRSSLLAACRPGSRLMIFGGVFPSAHLQASCETVKTTLCNC
jgi:hypothetical protein